jgi:predicted nucleotidyltransferase
MLARILAEWTTGRQLTLYLYGSRVRGDHRPDSDVDIHIKWGDPDNDCVRWWSDENEEWFKTINSKLPGPIQILERMDPLADSIMAAHVVYEDRTVRCVWLKPK